MTRRKELASWMTSPDNAYFAKSYVNRVWGYLMGMGLIEPLDDIRAGNPPSNPELLEWLTQDFVESGFDARHLIRTICKSRVYQLSIETNEWNEDDQINFSHATPKRLPAEVLHDSIYFVTGSAPEFPGVPRGTRAVQLPDVGVKLADGFLANLGRPVRESACECERSSELQLGSILSLVSGPTVDQAISDSANAIADLIKKQSDDTKVIDELYWRILNRAPRPAEVEQNLLAFNLIEKHHEDIETQLASYERDYAPIQKRIELEHQKRVANTEADLNAYLETIAAKEAELDAEQEKSVQQNEKALADHEATFDERFVHWSQSAETGTSWEAMDIRSVSASNDTKLVLQRDSVIQAEGKLGKTEYVVLGKAGGEALRAIRLEALIHDTLPKNGPGRADDGNFVLTEIEVRWAPDSDPDTWKKIKLHKPQADFSQQNFPVKNAIDGNKSGNNGWAVSPQLGQYHSALFELNDPIVSDESYHIEIKLTQHYQGDKYAIGRFRLSITSDEGEIDLGIPLSIDSILALNADERSDGQQQSLKAFFEGRDKQLLQLKKALEMAKKPRPEDPQVTKLKARLELVSQPLPMDTTLKQLRRAFDLSSQQIKNTRLTAAQDVAWALINNPSFLFNH